MELGWEGILYCKYGIALKVYSIEAPALVDGGFSLRSKVRSNYAAIGANEPEPQPQTRRKEAVTVPISRQKGFSLA